MQNATREDMPVYGMISLTEAKLSDLSVLKAFAEKYFVLTWPQLTKL